MILYASIGALVGVLTGTDWYQRRVLGSTESVPMRDRIELVPLAMLLWPFALMLAAIGDDA